MRRGSFADNQETDRGSCVDTIMEARHANTENQDPLFQLGKAAESGKRVSRSVQNIPSESQTPGLLSPSSVPLNTSLNISELSISCVSGGQV